MNNSTKRVVCFGEIMLRLAPQGYLRFGQTQDMEATFGGAEANVSVSLANFGIPVSYVTKLPENPLGQAAINEIRKYGVDTSYIARGGERIGIFFLEKGASQRASKVVYDRKHSAISTAQAADFDWETILKDAGWFHFTGITPAISDSAAELSLAACQAAKRAGATISCDLNFRKNLWSSQKAGEVMGKLMEYVDVCIANEEDAEDVFGIKAKDTDVTSGTLNHDGYKDVAAQLQQRFGFKSVAITLRQSKSANDNTWGAMLYTGTECVFSRKYDMHIVDRVGGGDSFAGGLIYSMLNGMSAQDTIEFATAASCLKHSIEGDFNLVTLAEVKALCGGDASGRVKR